MSAKTEEQEHQLTATKPFIFEYWNKLSLEIRLTVWELLYTTTPARIVEVQTAKHNHTESTHGFCPRTSPSPAPYIVNICHESRAQAQHLARNAGHFPFHTAPNTPDIYFNSEIDTLYISDREFWTRGWDFYAGLPDRDEWTSGEFPHDKGILDDIKLGPRPESLRSLAIYLDPLGQSAETRHITREQVASEYLKPITWDILTLQGLEEITFVVEEPEKEIGWVYSLNYHLYNWVRLLRRHPAHLSLDENKHLYPANLPSQVDADGNVRSVVEQCRLATRCGTQFEFVDQRRVQMKRHQPAASRG